MAIAMAMAMTMAMTMAMAMPEHGHGHGHGKLLGPSRHFSWTFLALLLDSHLSTQKTLFFVSPRGLPLYKLNDHFGLKTDFP